MRQSKVTKALLLLLARRAILLSVSAMLQVAVLADLEVGLCSLL